MRDVKASSGDGDRLPFDDTIPQGRAKRAASLLSLTARTAGEGTAYALCNRLVGSDTTSFHVRTAERYAEFLGRSKGVLMKAGQMLSFAPASPLVSPELMSVYRSTLARLRDNAPPMEPELAQAVLERELGPAEDAFAEFNWLPFAAASVGQVHAARMHDGRAVAVKIQYPGVGDAIVADLENTELLATFFSLFVGLVFLRRPSLDLRAIAHELGALIGEELDYRQEASNQAEFAHHYRGHPFIHVPEIVDELCTAHVLTQELVEGLDWAQACAADHGLRARWAEAIWRFGYGSNVRLGVFHGDPHPGNYVFHEDGTMSFLDFGCIKRLRPEYSGLMPITGLPCIEGDVLGTWRACVELGLWDASDPVTPEEVFAYWHPPLEMYWGDQPFTVTPEHAAKWARQRLSPEGPAANALLRSTAPADFTIFGRLEGGITAVIAELRASVQWRAISGEHFAGKPPLTEMGKLERDFFAGARGT